MLLPLWIICGVALTIGRGGMAMTRTFPFLPVAYAIGIGQVAFAATQVGGFIATDTRWDLAGSPYIASSSVVVDSGATLRIDQGVEVRFAATTGLVVVNGTLAARGSAGSSVIFTADQPGDTSRWNGIRFGDRTVDALFDKAGNYLSGSILEHATIELIGQHSFGAIRIESSAPYFSASIVHDNLSTGIVALGANGLRIVGNEFRDNSADATWGGGMRITNGDGAIIRSNRIIENSSYQGGGILLEDISNVVVIGNEIERNFGRDSGAGVKIDAGNNITIAENIVAENEGWPDRASGINILGGANNVTLLNNVVARNKTVAGLGIELSSHVTIAGNRIIDNPGDGIRFSSPFSNIATNVVISSDALNPTSIFGNGGFEIFNNQLFEVSTDPLAKGNVDARNVWWNTTDAPTIHAGVFDFFDDSLKGIVFVDPIATSAPSNGDFNRDGTVDAADYVVWRKNGGTQASYTVWSANFGKIQTASVSVMEVPEPATWLLLAASVVAIGRPRCRFSQ